MYIFFCFVACLPMWVCEYSYNFPHLTLHAPSCGYWHLACFSIWRLSVWYVVLLVVLTAPLIYIHFMRFNSTHSFLRVFWFNSSTRVCLQRVLSPKRIVCFFPHKSMSVDVQKCAYIYLTLVLHFLMKAMMMAVVGGMFPNKLACTKREWKEKGKGLLRG